VYEVAPVREYATLPAGFSRMEVPTLKRALSLREPGLTLKERLHGLRRVSNPDPSTNTCRLKVQGTESLIVTGPIRPEMASVPSVSEPPMSRESEVTRTETT
jgi:hypothetical protein